MRAIWSVVFLAASGCIAFAQAPSPVAVPVEQSGPGPAVRTFVNAMQAGDRSRARSTMDLSSLPFPVRDTEGNRYAGLLLSTLSRIKGLRLSELPATSSNSPFDIPVTDSSGHPVADLTLQKFGAGVWQFSASTVMALPRTFDLVRNWPQENEIGFVQDPEPDPSMEVRAKLPDSLLQPLLWLEIWQWLGALALIALSWLISRFTRLIVGGVLRLVLPKSKLNIGANCVRSLKRSAGMILATGLWWSFYKYLGLEGTWLLLEIVLLKAFWITGVAWLISALVDAIMDVLANRGSSLIQRADHILIPIARKLIRFVIVVCGLLAFASSMDVNVVGLVAGVGVGGLVVAFAAKDSVENVFGSLTILFDMPFGIGDWIKMGDINGVVEEINLRSTRIRTFHDTVVTLPNSNLIKASVENFGARRYRQLKFTLPVSYASDVQTIQKFCDGARKAMSENDKIRKDDAFVHLHSMGENSLGVFVQCYFLAASYDEELELRDSLLTQLMQIASESKLNLGSQSWAPPGGHGIVIHHGTSH